MFAIKANDKIFMKIVKKQIHVIIFFSIFLVFIFRDKFSL